MRDHEWSIDIPDEYPALKVAIQKASEAAYEEDIIQVLVKI